MALALFASWSLWSIVVILSDIAPLLTTYQVTVREVSTLEAHQTRLLERTEAAIASPSLSESTRKKLGEIAQKCATETDMPAGASTHDVLRAACGEYTPGRVHGLSHVVERQLTADELRDGGLEVFDPRKDYGGAVNSLAGYEFSNETVAREVVARWGDEMSVGSQLCGAVRAKIDNHDWSSGVQLRVAISGEGKSASAAKYQAGLTRPPTAERAREPRQVNGRVANDGLAWNIPAGAFLAGESDALETARAGTLVWRRDDPSRASREIHEAILPLGFWGGVVWTPGSLSLNQKVGGTFSDEERSRGGNILEQRDSLLCPWVGKAVALMNTRKCVVCTCPYFIGAIYRRDWTFCLQCCLFSPCSLLS